MPLWSWVAGWILAVAETTELLPEAKAGEGDLLAKILESSREPGRREPFCSGGGA